MATVPYTFVYPSGAGQLTYLGLVNRLLREAGAATQVTTLQGTLSQEALIYSDWIQQAWTELQTKHDDWPWMRSSALSGDNGGGVSFPTVATQAVYPFGTGTGTIGIEMSGFTKWDRSTFRNAPTGSPASEIFMDPLEYDTWRDAYAYGAQRNSQSRPTIVAIGPNQEVCVGPFPSAGWTVIGDYFIAPSIMVADTDLPVGLPTQYQMVIVYQAMEWAGDYEADAGVATRGQRGYAKLIRQLEATRAMRLLMGAPLA